MVAPECIWHGTSDTEAEMRGPEGFLKLHARLLDAFPDMHIVLGDIFGAGEQVAVRWTATMQHLGNGLGIEPTGAKIAIHGMGIARFADGKVVEAWDSWDKLGLTQQIEAARARTAAGA
jgi:predicted ester cyclase